MEDMNHSFNQMFEQLGLEGSDTAIDQFIAANQLPATTPLEQAPFWSEGQKQFLLEARSQDADWAVHVDELDTLLHKESMH
ncbi:MAG: DUF2789 family protein [Gammaproteobacteria bacterium]